MGKNGPPDAGKPPLDRLVAATLIDGGQVEVASLKVPLKEFSDAVNVLSQEVQKDKRVINYRELLDVKELLDRAPLKETDFNKMRKLAKQEKYLVKLMNATQEMVVSEGFKENSQYPEQKMEVLQSAFKALLSLTVYAELDKSGAKEIQVSFGFFNKSHEIVTADDKRAFLDKAPALLTDIAQQVLQLSGQFSSVESQKIAASMVKGVFVTIAPDIYKPNGDDERSSPTDITQGGPSTPRP